MLAGGEKSRVDQRTTAMLQAQIRGSRGVGKVRVGDLSPHGLLGSCERPPVRGEIVDIMIGGHHIVGEVRWVSGRRFGIRARERIDVAGIMAGRVPGKRKKGKKIEQSRNPHDGSQAKLLASYGVLALTAFATAYLIVNYFIL